MLDALGYVTRELLLTPLQFGVPNSRLRYYLLAKLKPLAFADTYGMERQILRHIPGRGCDWTDPRRLRDGSTPEELCAVDADEIRCYLDPGAPSGRTHPQTIPDNVLMKWGRLFDIILPSARRSCCFTRGPCIPSHLKAVADAAH